MKKLALTPADVDLLIQAVRYAGEYGTAFDRKTCNQLADCFLACYPLLLVEADDFLEDEPGDEATPQEPAQ